ncbi:MAG: DinB family protein [Sphingobacteriales bacterium]|nr:MAG: DinB family protein [Sphingobacteriales bacterium]
MTLNDFFRGQLAQESETTRKMLSIVPDDKYDWKPHDKSMTLRSLATHIAELPTWFPMVYNTDELDFAAAPYQPVSISKTSDLMAYFEKCVAEGLAVFTNDKEELLEKTWTLRNGEEIYAAEPKREMIRSTMSQIIHHRAQLGVYLRLLNIPIPGSYGPSADEMEMYDINE